MSTTESRTDNYVLSTTDLMVGILFIVLIIVFYFVFVTVQNAQIAAVLDSEKMTQNKRIEKLERENAQLKDDNAKLRSEVNRLTVEVAKAREAMKKAQDANKELRDIFAEINKSREKLLKEISDRIKEAGFPVISIPKRGIIRLPEGKLFDKGKYLFSQEGERNVATLVTVLRKLLPCYVALSSRAVGAGANCPEAPHKIEAIFLEGHTDSQKVHKHARYKDNKELAARRALSAFKFIDEDPVLSQLRNGKGEYLFGVSGYGETRPICLEKNENCYNINRRIDLRFLMQSPEKLINPSTRN